MTADGQDGQNPRALLGLDSSIAGLLHLLGTGAGGQILLALGEGPLRTEELTARIRDFSSRSVYRRTTKLVAHNVIDRHEEPGVPSTVVLSLSEPEGRELFDLVHAFATTSTAGLPGEEPPAHFWSSLDLLGEMWKLGFVEQLSHRTRSLAELTSGPHEMTHHQVHRRVGLFLSSGLLTADPPKGNGKRYELSEHGRRCMALIAGLGRWRRCAVPDGAAGLTPAEMATVLRVALPLTSLPRHAGSDVDLVVSASGGGNGRREALTLRGLIDIDGVMRFEEKTKDSAQGSARATVTTWLAALLDGHRGRFRVRGDLTLVDAVLTQLHEVLWEKKESPLLA